jgi:hypothetical protein
MTLGVRRPLEMASQSGIEVELHAEATYQKVKGMTERLNKYSIVLEPGEAILFLSVSARDYRAMGCEVPWCAICTGFLRTWQDVYEGLSDNHKRQLEDLMGDNDIPIPPLFKGA